MSNAQGMPQEMTRAVCHELAACAKHMQQCFLRNGMVARPTIGSFSPFFLGGGGHGVPGNLHTCFVALATFRMLQSGSPHVLWVFCPPLSDWAGYAGEGVSVEGGVTTSLHQYPMLSAEGSSPRPHRPASSL